MKKRTLAILLLAAMLLLAACGTAAPDNEAAAPDDEAAPPARVLLAAYNYDVDGVLNWESVYTYDEAGRLMQETTSWYNYSPEYGPYIYDFTYDDAGRLLTKTSSNRGGADYHAEGDVERTYTEDGSLLTYSYHGMIDQWTTEAYLYDDDGALTGETLTIVGAHHYDISEAATDDGGKRIVKHDLETPALDHVLIYDAEGRLTQGFDDYWVTPIHYTYYDTPYLTVRYERTDVELDSGVQPMERIFAYITDSAGFEIAFVPLGMSGETELLFDADGYLTGANLYDPDGSPAGTAVLVYGAPTESVAWASPDEVSVQGPEFETVWVPSGLSVLPGRKSA